MCLIFRHPQQGGNVRYAICVFLKMSLFSLGISLGMLHSMQTHLVLAYHLLQMLRPCYVPTTRHLPHLPSAAINHPLYHGHLIILVCIQNCSAHVFIKTLPHPFFNKTKQPGETQFRVHRKAPRSVLHHLFLSLLQLVKT